MFTISAKADYGLIIMLELAKNHGQGYLAMTNISATRSLSSHYLTQITKPLREANLLKSKEDCRFYGPYNTTIEVNHFIGKILASSLLLFLPFKFIFLLFSLFMFLMFLISCKIKNIIKFKRDGRKKK